MAGRIRVATFNPTRVAECLKENLKKANKDKSKKALYVDKSINNFNSGSRRG